MDLIITNGFLTASFNALGAELISLKTEKREYIWNGNPDFWGKHSPILFPIVGALKDDTFFYQNKTYQLPRHGFAREKQFEVIEHKEDKIVFSLKNDAETLKIYPFCFELRIEYQLHQNILDVKYWVQNTDRDKMYFSIGGHPAFQLSENFENHALEFETNSALHFSLLNQNLLEHETAHLTLQDKKLPLSYELFEQDALVFCNQDIQAISITDQGKTILKVHFEQFPDLGLWTKSNAPFICIEPWFGYADVVSTNQNLTTKEGIQQLEANQIFTAQYAIEIF